MAANQPNSFFCRCMTIVHTDWASFAPFVPKHPRHAATCAKSLGGVRLPFPIKQMSELDHSRHGRRWPKSRFVHCCPNSRQKFATQRTQRCAIKRTFVGAAQRRRLPPKRRKPSSQATASPALRGSRLHSGKKRAQRESRQIPKTGSRVLIRTRLPLRVEPRPYRRRTLRRPDIPTNSVSVAMQHRTRFNSSASLDYLVREGDQIRRNRETERLCDLKIYNEFVFGWCLHR